MSFFCDSEDNKKQCRLRYSFSYLLLTYTSGVTHMRSHVAYDKLNEMPYSSVRNLF